MERLTYRDNSGRALLTHFGKQMYCSTQATADCFCELEERLEKAISLLKAQEPAHVQKCEFANMWLWCCGSCGVAITEGDKFCRMCGKAVKYDE